MLNCLCIDPAAADVLDNPPLPRHMRLPREQEPHAANGLQRPLPRLLAFKQLQMQYCKCSMFTDANFTKVRFFKYQSLCDFVTRCQVTKNFELVGG